MQDEVKVKRFKEAVGSVIHKTRVNKTSLSINKLANEYDFHKGNLSKTERGLFSIHLLTAWRISEALGLKFVNFAELLQEELGDDFTFIDE